MKLTACNMHICCFNNGMQHMHQVIMSNAIMAKLSYCIFTTPQRYSFSSSCICQAFVNYLSYARNDSKKNRHAITSARPTTPATWNENKMVG